MKQTLNFFLCIAAVLMLLNACTTPATENKPFDVAELEDEWEKLSKTDSGMVIFHPCDALNMKVYFTKTDTGYVIEISEGHEGSRYKVLQAHKTPKDTILINTKPIDWGPETREFKFLWVDKQKGLALWIATYWESTFYDTIVSKEHVSDYPLIKQPCEECWEEDDCAYWAKDAAIKDIKRIFTEYTQYSESTDSKDDKELMLSSLQDIKVELDSAEYRLILDVWMYYDPTDFDDEGNIFRILMIDQAKSVAAILTRMVNKEEWESPEHAPLSDLDRLRKNLEGN